MKENDIKQFVENNKLTHHEEGGYYKVTYVSQEKVSVSAPYEGDSRPAISKIDYALFGDDFSSWHRILSNEKWRFKEGTSLTLHILQNDGNLLEVKIGDPEKEEGAKLDFVVEGGQWFSASVNDKSSYCVVECIVTPGFEYRDWALGNKNELSEQFPKHSEIIERYSSRHQNLPLAELKVR